jgi:diguanylate cyclase (GGDEF)-like protein/PAS domain S-box-containing protein
MQAGLGTRNCLNAEDEEKRRSLFAAMAEGAIFLDERGVAVAVNPSAERILGRKAADLLGHSAEEWAGEAVREDGAPFPPASLPFMVTLRDGEPQSDVVMGLPRPDGSFVWVSVNAQPARPAEGAEPWAAVATFHDITARRQADQERLAHLKFFENMDRISRAMQGAVDPEQMLADALDVVVSIFDCEAARLIYPCDSNASRWRVVVERRRGAARGAPEEAERVISGDAAGRLQAAAAEAGTVQLDGGSEIALALRPKIGKPWLFALQRGRAPEEWTAEQDKVMQEIGGRLSACLCSLLAYRELQASERKYEEIFDNVSDALLLLDVVEGGRFRIADLNPVAAKLIGLSADQEIKGFLDSALDRSIMEQVEPRLRQCVRTGLTVSYEELMRFPSGLRFLRSVYVPLRDEQGRVYRVLAVHTDIASLKETEEALRESDAKLREAQEMAEVASWDWDLAADALHWSAGERRLLGAGTPGSPSTFVEFMAFVHPDDRGRLKEGIDRIRRTGEPFELEYRIVRPSGETRVVEARMKGFPGAGREIVRIGGAVRDVTKAKEAEERLKAASLYARSLIEASLDPLITISPAGRITDINEAAVRVLDAPRETIMGGEFADCFTEPERAAAAFRAALNTGNVSNRPLTIRQSNGELIHVLLNASIYRNAKGEAEGVFAAARDVTEHNRRSQELVKLHEQMTATVAELRQREHDTAIIGELSETLQTCKSRDEAYPLIGSAGRQLFPWSNGGLAVVSPEGLELHTVARWGDKPLMQSDFPMDACWALRRGQLHLRSGPEEGALCSHFEEPPQGPSMCLPLALAGEALGMLHLSASASTVFDDRVRRLMVTLGDVVKLSLSNLKLRETLRMQAIRDPLTGLFNRHYLNETLPREIMRAQRLGLPLCVAMLDVDHFKQFNDRYGHDAGDMVLKEVGNLLRKSVRESDMACRYGGEEFLFVLPECDMPSALARMRQIRDDIRNRTPLFRGRAVSPITLSVGLAQLGDRTSTQAELIAAADEALYAAKNAGRDRACVFPDGVKK